MRGEAATRVRRVLVAGAGGGALTALAALAVFVAGNARGLPDATLLLALGWSRAMATGSLVFAAAAFLATALVPAFGGRFSFRNLVAVILFAAIAAAALVASSLALAAVGGLSF